MSERRLYLLGPPRLSVGDRSVALAPTPAALLGFLALHGSSGRGVSRGRVAGVLWPERAEPDARRELTKALYRLRRLVGEDAGWLRADAGALALGPLWLDLAEFRLLAAS